MATKKVVAQKKDCKEDAPPHLDTVGGQAEFSQLLVRTTTEAIIGERFRVNLNGQALSIPLLTKG